MQTRPFNWIHTILLLAVFGIAGQVAATEGDDDFLDRRKPRLPSSQTLTLGPEDSKLYSSPGLVLAGYAVGATNHELSRAFASRVVQQINATISATRRIVAIEVRGYADGLSNAGLKVNRTKTSDDCLQYIGASNLIDDATLARIRGCQVAQLILERVRLSSNSALVRLTTSFLDIPDGGVTGPEHRKVVVELTVLETGVD